MRKQTKLVAVLSAAALLAVGASMTSFAGWEKDEDGIWHYYDSDDEMVTDEWRKDGSKWFYLDEDGNMLTEAWVDDEYYVGADGAMVKNDWVKTTADEDVSDPEDDGDNWYYFGSNGKKVEDDSKKINGKTYYFNEDGEMRYGWYEDNGDVFYLGGEDEGWRAESQWLWLALPDEDEVDRNGVNFCDDDSACSVHCDEEGWYYFGSNGKMYKEAAKKKVNGKYYFFNAHGQMLYEWINNQKYRVSSSSDLVSGNGYTAPGAASSSNGILDDNANYQGSSQIWNMQYSNVVEDGSRANGWYEIDGSADTGEDGDTDWYYFDDGEAERADAGKDFVTVDGDGADVFRAKIKINGKYFCFNEMGQMQTGLQYIAAENGFYYFDDNGYPVDGKVSDVECDDDSYAFRFETKNGHNGKGIQGEKDNYLYFNGKRLEADDDYRLYYLNGDIYLVNSKGKVQSTKSDSKKYDIENEGIETEDVNVTFTGKKVKSISVPGGEEYTADELVAEAKKIMKADGYDPSEDSLVSIPFIQLYDDDQYTYTVTGTGENETVIVGWRGLNNK